MVIIGETCANIFNDSWVYDTRVVPHMYIGQQKWGVFSSFSTCKPVFPSHRANSIACYLSLESELALNYI